MTDPEPRSTAGLEPGGGVAPGDTPPAEDGTSSGINTPERPELRRAWGPAPMVLIVGGACLVAALFVVMGIVQLMN